MMYVRVTSALAAATLLTLKPNPFRHLAMSM
jgi:hypothetical protein